MPSPISSDALLSPGGSFLHSKSYRNLSSTDGDLKTPEVILATKLRHLHGAFTNVVRIDSEAPCQKGLFFAPILLGHKVPKTLYCKHRKYS